MHRLFTLILGVSLCALLLLGGANAQNVDGRWAIGVLGGGNFWFNDLNQMKIGLDIMGGDHAPKATTRGAILAQREMPPDVELVLIGDKQAIETVCREENLLLT